MRFVRLLSAAAASGALAPFVMSACSGGFRPAEPLPVPLMSRLGDDMPYNDMPYNSLSSTALSGYAALREALARSPLNDDTARALAPLLSTNSDARAFMKYVVYCALDGDTTITTTGA